MALKAEALRDAAAAILALEAKNILLHRFCREGDIQAAMAALEAVPPGATK